MDASWQFYLFTLFAISPSFLILVIFRFRNPSYRISPFFKSNAVAFLLATIFTSVVNGRLLLAFVAWALADTDPQKVGETLQVSKELLGQVLNPEKCFWLPTTSLFSDCTLFRDAPKSIVSLVVNLHLRAVFFAFAPIAFIWMIAWLWQMCTQKSTCAVVKWVNRFAEEIANLPLHPWAVLTKADTRTEVLIADVLTPSGLYMGMVSDWHPDESNSAEAIVLTNVLKFERTVVEEGGKKVLRANKYLFPHSGDVLIPIEKVENSHFWRLDKSARIVCDLWSTEDFAYLKWWLLIAYEHDLEKIYFKIILHDRWTVEDLKRKFNDLKVWAQNKGISLNKILEQVPSEDASTELTNSKKS